MLPTFKASDAVAAVVVMVTAIGMPGVAWAQAPVTSFDQLATRLRTGDTVMVTDKNGQVVKGKVVDLSASSLVLRTQGETRDVQAATVTAITWQRPHSLKKGALTGLVIGAAVAVVVIALPAGDCTDCEDVAGAKALLAAISIGAGAGIGCAVGAATPGKEVLVYRAPSSPSAGRISIAPILTPRRQGVAIRVSF